MTPRLRWAATGAALLAAFWLGMRVQGIRHQSAMLAADAEAANAAEQAADGPPVGSSPENLEDLGGMEADASESQRQPLTPSQMSARFAQARSAVTDIQRVRLVIMATADLSTAEISTALDLLEKDPAEEGEKDILFIGILTRWAELDPAAAAAYASQQASRNSSKEQALQTVVGEWAIRDANAAMRFVESLAKDKRDSAVEGLLSGIAATRPEMALSLLPRFEEKGQKNTFYRAIFTSWSQRNPQAAAAYAVTLPEGEGRNTALNQVANGLTQRDPSGAMTWAAQLQNKEERRSALARVLDHWAKFDPGAASQRLLAMNDPDITRESAGVIAEALAEKDFGTARQFAGQLPGKDARETAQRAIASEMAHRDLPQAVLYVGQMPEGEAREAAYSDLANTWSAKDPVAAAGWLGRLPPGASRDAAVSGYVQYTVNTDGEGAMAWAATISEAKFRAAMLKSTFDSWRRQSPAPAKQWLETNRTLPPEAKAALSKDN